MSTRSTYQDHLRHAYSVALDSPDPSTQNGAVVLNSFGLVIGKGCNTFTKGFDGVPPESDLFTRPKKYAFIEHAERNALFATVRAGFRPHTLVAAWASCADCARSIVGLGVQCLIRHVREDTEGRWNESIVWGDEILKAGGVTIIDVSDYLGAQPVLFNGKLINP